MRVQVRAVVHVRAWVNMGHYAERSGSHALPCVRLCVAMRARARARVLIRVRVRAYVCVCVHGRVWGEGPAWGITPEAKCGQVCMCVVMYMIVCLRVCF